MPDDHHFGHQDDSENRNATKANPFSRFYRQRVEGFNSLYTLIGTSDDSDVIHNAQYILETLVAKVDQTVDGTKLLDDVVLRKENIQILFNCLKCSNKYRRKAGADILNLIFSLLMNEVIEEPDKRNSLMASTTITNPEFSKYYEQKRKDEKNALFQTFVDELEEIIAGISQRRTGERTFNNSIGKEVKIIDYSDIKILQLIQSSLKFNVENINMIVSFSDYFDLLFVGISYSRASSRPVHGTRAFILCFLT